MLKVGKKLKRKLCSYINIKKVDFKINTLREIFHDN